MPRIGNMQLLLWTSKVLFLYMFCGDCVVMDSTECSMIHNYAYYFLFLLISTCMHDGDDGSCLTSCCL
jgi:hypothetical protein